MATIEDLQLLVQALQSRIVLFESGMYQKDMPLVDGRSGLSRTTIRSQLLSKEKETSAMNRVLGLIQGEQSLLDCALRQIENASTSVGRLPDEVLSLIFAYGPGGENSIAFRDSISRVCYRWRKVIIKTRSCWTFVSYYSNAVGCSSLEALRTYIERAGTALLDLHIRLSEPEGSDLEQIATRNSAFKALELYLPRCRTLHFETDFYVGDVLLVIPTPMPALEKLVIEYDWYETPENPIRLSTGPQCAPLAIELRADGGGEVLLNTEGLDCSRLVSFCVQARSWKQSVLEILTRSSTLVQFRWIDWSEWSIGVEDLEELEFPALKHLLLDLDVDDFFTRIRAPSLHTMHLRHTDGSHASMLFRPLRDFIALRALRLDNAVSEIEAETPHFLLSFPNLEVLSYTAFHAFHIVDLTIIARPSSTVSAAYAVCPNLRLLELNVETISSSKIKALDHAAATLLRALVRSRGAKVLSQSAHAGQDPRAVSEKDDAEVWDMGEGEDEDEDEKPWRPLDDPANASAWPGYLLIRLGESYMGQGYKKTREIQQRYPATIP